MSGKGKVTWLSMIMLALTAALATELAAQPVPDSGSAIEAAERLEPGQFLWAPDVAPEGPVLLVVSVATQRAVLYRNGIPIGISTVSTGRPGYRTPTGIFTVLQRHVEHYSSLYNNAPMPYMQRLTWGGVALHGGDLPGYPASHGCIRLPHEFARRLYGVTHLGMTVVVTDRAALPRLAPAGELLGNASSDLGGNATTMWRPDLASDGPVSIVISVADRRIVILRNGTLIGSAPVAITGRITRTSAFMLHRVDEAGRHWLQIPLPGFLAGESENPRGRIEIAEPFRRDAEAILRPGATVVVTPDALHGGGTGRALTVVETESSNP